MNEYGGDPCQERDDYGDNQCHYDWGETARANVSLSWPHQIEGGDFLSGHLKMDRFVPYHFRCPLCGEDCVLKLPLINMTHTIPMPKNCPIPAQNSSQPVHYQLLDRSPTDGKVPVRVDGIVSLIQGKTGKTLVEFTVEGHIR
jgi:hypothetical protein